jgi:hypothetical protein
MLRFIFAVALASLALTDGALAQEARPIVIAPQARALQTPPAAAVAPERLDVLMARQPVHVQARVRALAAREPFETAELSPATRAELANLGGGDIEALTMLVLMQSAQSAQDDLKTAMEDVRATNERCASARQADVALSAMARAVTRDAAQSANVIGRQQGCPAALAREDERRTTTIARLREIGEDIAETAELSEEQALRLQTLMQRRSAAMEALSNMLRRMSETADDITQNLK